MLRGHVEGEVRRLSCSHDSRHDPLNGLLAVTMIVRAPTGQLAVCTSLRTVSRCCSPRSSTRTTVSQSSGLQVSCPKPRHSLPFHPSPCESVMERVHAAPAAQLHHPCSVHLRQAGAVVTCEVPPYFLWPATSITGGGAATVNDFERVVAISEHKASPKAPPLGAAPATHKHVGHGESACGASTPRCTVHLHSSWCRHLATRAR